ncbi:hypothetical protein BAUCODRAFT_70204 [Baudoinia panamericana UAMH 10762]|uniref:Mitochondrial escape protein 2 n=1 Tax=Baudoinia panamericana (strain UAMH 10762) TaxID=717646 RepID=M2NBE8_BAUPA|nr:uncharacterized protein BAUCODRAFT_70204 [Baudoinia panamericana UAMH 10762]EMC96215.1 hypothetical protein BAUCODRAFT_70204 [Baudoinia panamericana UAMH 10762]
MLQRRLLLQRPCLRSLPVPRLHQRSRLRQVRHATAEAGENESGHIATTPNEGILFFNNLLPLSIPFMRLLPFVLRSNKSSILQDADKWMRVGALVVEILPRLREAGAFLKFQHQEQDDPATVAEAVRQYLRAHPTRPWWNPFDPVRAGLVVGKPWVEDLFRLPSKRLKVEFLPTAPGAEVAELNQEQLYAFFRPYGKLADIVVQPSDSKIMPRFAYLDYSQVGKAIMAKNCLHGFTVPEPQGGGKLGTIFRITYEKRRQGGWIWDWITNHPRIVFPIVVALVAGISVTIFDPIRTLSIKAHITHSFHIEDNVIFRWFKTQSEDLLKKVRELRHGVDESEAGMQVVWDDRKADIEQIQSWLMETADTFIVVQGPRGSGKRELVIDHALQRKQAAHRVLVVDCKPVQEARGDGPTIAAAASQVGYWPVFSWMNSLNGMLDLAAQGLTGVKAGFSETLDTQLSKIWNSTAVALKSIALEGRKKDDKDANLSDDEYLEAHPERRPVVVIDNFLHKSSDAGAGLVYDKLAEWAARLTTTNVAHVIFLTNDLSYSKSLGRALPDRVFRQITLRDCSLETAKRYVIHHLDFDKAEDRPTQDESDEARKLTPSQKRKDLAELDHVIPLLGGRLTDLEFLARRIKAGETPTKAVHEIIEQSASEILKMYLLSGGGSGSSGETREWSIPQAWTLIRSLAASETLRYNEMLLLDAYKSAGDRALAALEQAELITVQSLNGRPCSIGPGKPVYRPAFQRLVDDKVLAAKMDLAVLGESIGNENKSIDGYERELHLLGELPKQPGELRGRVQWLLGKIEACQGKIEGYEKESAGLKKILVSEY